MQKMERSTAHSEEPRPRSLEVSQEEFETLAYSYGATPLIDYEHPEVMQRQIGVYNALLEAIVTQAPADMPEHIVRYIEFNFMARFMNRTLHNQDSFDSRLVTDLDGLTAQQRLVYEKALNGVAQLGELMDVQQFLGMKSIELARLTHIYRSKIELLRPMRAEVTAAILERGGYVPDDPRERYKIIHCDIANNPENNHVDAGLMITRKRTVGVLPNDTHVMERASFILRIDPDSNFDQNLADAMRQVNIKEDPDWRERIWQAGRLGECVPALLANDDYETVVPNATTVYTYSKPIDEACQTRKAQELQIIRANNHHEQRARALAEEYRLSEQLAGEAPLSDPSEDY